ncbi:hypothetical protein [Streptomyces sp. NPDC097619]|uniref:hypothetical protein n=1 Tax=Streptomyces sp. NPDC097619 TaxID=3157228 RepID=UPI003327C413
MSEDASAPTRSATSTTHHHGPVVTMHGGQGNIGINNGTSNATFGGPDRSDVALTAAVNELSDRLRELAPQLTPDQAQAVEDALPELVPDRTVLRERALVLASVAQIAAASGAIGQPVGLALGQLFGALG